LREKENGIWKNVGWVSLFSKKGDPLLMQLEEGDYSTQNRMDLEAAKEENGLE